MDENMAGKLLAAELTYYKDLGFSSLVKLIGETIVLTRNGLEGEEYQIEIVLMWDDPRKPGENLRVSGAIDDGTFPSAFLPLTIDFVMAPDGSLVGA